MTENKENKQFFSREQIKFFIDLLKNQKAECRDFTDETLTAMMADKDFRLDDLPVQVRMELTGRRLIHADFTVFSAKEQLELLLNDIWYGLDDVTLAKQLKWDEFSPDALAALIKYHPGLPHNYQGWDWAKLKQADPLLWSSLLQRHAGFAKHCSPAVFKQLPTEELFKLAMANAGIAFKLPLNKLPQKMIDVLLREHPILTAHLDFEEDDPPGRLRLSCDQELLRQTEPDDICQFLQNLLTGLSAKEAQSILSSDIGHLGVFTSSRGELLKAQIEQFLAKQGFAPEALQVHFLPLKLSLFAACGNLEAMIEEHNIGRIVQYCLEEEKLQRVDIFSTENYFSLRRDIRCLILMKALPENQQSNALLSMTLDQVPPSIIAQAKAAFSFGKNPPGRSRYEIMLMEAALDGALTIIRDLAGTVTFSFLTKQEALKIAERLPEKAVQYLFNRSITPMLRAHLLTELTAGKATSEEVDLVNILLKPYWCSEDAFAADSICSYSDFEDDSNCDDGFEDEE